jgi:hypothetical protein
MGRILPKCLGKRRISSAEIENKEAIDVSNTTEFHFEAFFSSERELRIRISRIRSHAARSGDEHRSGFARYEGAALRAAC